jgi:hypothetical protein
VQSSFLGRQAQQRAILKNPKNETGASPIPGSRFGALSPIPHPFRLESLGVSALRRECDFSVRLPTAGWIVRIKR